VADLKAQDYNLFPELVVLPTFMPEKTRQIQADKRQVVTLLTQKLLI